MYLSFGEAKLVKTQQSLYFCMANIRKSCSNHSTQKDTSQDKAPSIPYDRDSRLNADLAAITAKSATRVIELYILKRALYLRALGYDTR